MGNFRITNITDRLGKRDIHYNTELKIAYVDGMDRKELAIGPGETTYLVVPKMPISIHRMRIKNWIKVDEIGDRELKKEMNKEKMLKNPPAEQTTETTTTTKKKRTYTKKPTKSSESTVENKE